MKAGWVVLEFIEQMLENKLRFAVRSMASFSMASLAFAFSFGSVLPVPAQPESMPTWSWEQLEKSGSEAFYKCAYGDAERLLKQAVIRGASFGESDLRFAKSLGELGRLYTVRGRFVDAEPLFEEELRVKEAAIGQDSIEIVPELGSMIHFYLAYGTAGKAEPLTEHLLVLVGRRLKEQMSRAQGSVKLEKGQPLTGWAGTAALSVRDPLLDWAITCDGLADSYRERSSFDYAERLYKAALDIKTSVLAGAPLACQ